MQVELLPAFKDNYFFILESDSTDVAVVDPGDADVVSDYIESHGKKLGDIFLTHHHWDHVSGVKKLVERYQPRVWGHELDRKRLPFLTESLRDGDTFKFRGRKVEVHDVSGHTIGHILYHFPKEKQLYVGDTLFHHGCGRMFEGNPEMYWESLKKIKSFDPDTMVFCAHEYTLSNLDFLLSIAPEDKKLTEQRERCQKQRKKGTPTIPFRLGEQLETNLFLQCDQMSLFGEGLNPTENFAELRSRKDRF